MKINRKLLPIKAHYFFFMAAMGPILPQLSVIGKELGISSVVMGTINAILPVGFLLAKPLFGLLVDYFRDHRKTIFMCIIAVMTLSYACMNFIPPDPIAHYDIGPINCTQLNADTCNVTILDEESRCGNTTQRVTCVASSATYHWSVSGIVYGNGTEFCKIGDTEVTCGLQEYKLHCEEDIETVTGCLYKTTTFVAFVVLMSVGTIGFNVVNSISDAICFDVIGEEYDYGKQRVWGTIGFGVTALISGYFIDLVSQNSFSYAPAFIILIVFSACDLLSCFKLKLPIMETPENIFKDLKKLMNNRTVITFIIFAIFAGIVDSFIIYFLFWFLEDLAVSTDTGNIKLIEGLIVAAETLGGEVIFFSISGKILERFGHVHCFSMCFINYALRLGLISVVPNPWWILPIEFVLQGPTYALTYTTIVAYANAIAPPGASATMQGIAAGMDDGFGYAVGSMLGGLLYRYVGGKSALQVFSAFGVVCSVLHLVLHKTVLQHHEVPGLHKEKSPVAEYRSPEKAVPENHDGSAEDLTDKVQNG